MTRLPRIWSVCLAAGAGLLAQTPSAVIIGTVVDQTGATVPQAAVTVINQETNVRSDKTTNADGAFTIINLLPGNYVLTVEKNGFKKQLCLPSHWMSIRLSIRKLHWRWALPEKPSL